MNEDLDFEEAFTLYGFEEAFKIILEQTVYELKDKTDPRVTLVRFHAKANALRRLEESDRRNQSSKKGKNAKSKKTKAKS